MEQSFTFAVNGIGRRDFLKFGVAGGAAFSLGSLLGHPLVSKALAQKKKREITIAIGTEISSLWPYSHIGTSPAAIALSGIFDTLTYWGSCPSSGSPTLLGGLAESWQFKGPEWTVKLRQGVKFHNGEDFTSAAVVDSLNRARGKKSRAKSPLVLVKDVQAIDAHTVKIITKRPLAQQMWGMTTVSIVSPAAIKQHGPDIKKHAVGTSLYRQVEWLPGNRLVMERVRNWWGFKASDDLPINKLNNIERITWRTIKEPIALMTALETGEVDVAQYVLPQEVDRLSKKKTVQVKEVKGTRIGLLIMNQRFKPFDDVRVRKAISYGINWELINERLLLGKVDNSYGPLLPGQIGYDGSLKPYPYDPAKAKALLREAGHGGGLDLEVTVTPSGVELKRVEIAQAMAQELKKVGINLKVRPVEFGFFIGNFFRNKLPFYIFAFTTYPDPWLYFAQFIYGKGARRSGYQNPQVDQLYEQAMGTLDDAKRGALYRQALKIVREDAVLVWRSSLNDYRGVSARLDYTPGCLDNYTRPQLMTIKA